MRLFEKGQCTLINISQKYVNAPELARLASFHPLSLGRTRQRDTEIKERINNTKLYNSNE